MAGAEISTQVETPESRAAATWLTALGALQLQVSKPNFRTWLKDTIGLKDEREIGSFTIGAPSSFVVEWLEKRLNSLVAKTLGDLLETTVEPSFVVYQPGQNGNGHHKENAVDLPVQTQAINPPRRPSCFNPEYTFDSLARYSGNRLAVENALQAAAGGCRFIPLVITGAPSQGKTHILHAIGNQATTNHPDWEVLYATAAEYTGDFTSACRDKDFGRLAKYNDADLLLIDDFHFFGVGDKSGTQSNFLRCLATMQDYGQRRMVIACNCDPCNLDTLSTSLRKRLELGLVAPIEPPDIEGRKLILEAKAKAHNITLPGAILEMVAGMNGSSHSSLNKLIAVFSLDKDREKTLEWAEQILAYNKPEGALRNQIEPERIIEVVCKGFGVPTESLYGKGRDNNTALARHVAMYLFVNEAHLTTTKAGEELGRRNHTTVLHSVSVVKKMIAENPEMAAKIKTARNQLYSG